MSTQPPPIVLDPTGANRQAESALLRSHGSAVRVDILGVTAWSVTDPDLLKKLLTSDDVSKDARAHWPAFGEVVQSWPLALWVAVNNMFTAYGHAHARLRRMIAPAFSARRVQALAPFVDTTVDSLLDELEALPGGGTVDLRDRLAHPLPIAVICRLMGVPTERREAFRTVVDGVFATTLTAEQATANAGALRGMLDELITARRAEPGDDLTSLLVSARDEEAEDGRGLSDDELRDTLLLMISAGYETTVNVIDQAVSLLLAHPEQLDRVREGHADWNDVVEETLRLEPAITHLPMRYAVRDVHLPDGGVIPKGEAILASYAAANRHPAWHADADTFDITRVTKEHLAFGHGVHFCLGAPLARMELAAALKGLFGRFPLIELAVPAEELEPLGSLLSNGHKTLPVRLRPSEGQPDSTPSATVPPNWR
ncbi:cytochrome P450 [Streptomyces sp. NPDC101490]|uniref:cytochrome P450 family protein n=1 Tax=Streptomyces sp. NPDC101490 TaxID=3366143 RepID=UPI00381E9ADE